MHNVRGGGAFVNNLGPSSGFTENKEGGKNTPELVKEGGS